VSPERRSAVILLSDRNKHLLGSLTGANDPLRLRLMKRIFKRAGLEVTTAEDGPWALEAEAVLVAQRRFPPPPSSLDGRLLMADGDGRRLAIADDCPIPVGFAQE